MAMPLVTRAILYTAFLAAMAGAVAAPHLHMISGPLAQASTPVLAAHS